jgi:hypothetical protein
VFATQPAYFSVKNHEKTSFSIQHGCGNQNTNFEQMMIRWKIEADTDRITWCLGCFWLSLAIDNNENIQASWSWKCCSSGFRGKLRLYNKGFFILVTVMKSLKLRWQFHNVSKLLSGYFAASGFQTFLLS